MFQEEDFIIEEVDVTKSFGSVLALSNRLPMPVLVRTQPTNSDSGNFVHEGA